MADQGSVMRDGAAHALHERTCPHKPQRWRWHTVDGCSGTLCGPCWRLPGSPALWRDLLVACLVGDDGLPIAKFAWSDADVARGLSELIPAIREEASAVERRVNDLRAGAIERDAARAHFDTAYLKRGDGTLIWSCDFVHGDPMPPAPPSPVNVVTVLTVECGADAGARDAG